MKKKLLASLTLAALAFCAVAAPMPSYRAATNIAENVSYNVVTNTVTKAYVESLGVASEETDPVWELEKSGYATKSDVNSATNTIASAVADTYKTKQTAKTSPIPSTAEEYQFIDTISQDTNGVITATKKTMRMATTSAPGMVQLNDNINSTRTDQAATIHALSFVAGKADAAISFANDAGVAAAAADAKATAAAIDATNYTDSVAQSLGQTIPNDISRTQTDAVLVHKDGSNVTNLFYVRQATHSLAGLMTAADKSALDTLKSTVEEQSTAIQTVADDEEQTRQIVTTWENFLDGSNVVFSITNYISGTYSLDAAKMRILELRDGEYREVYNSRDEILLHIQDFKENDFATATNQVIGAVNTAIENKADRDWGKYTSAGGEAPSNTVYMTAPNTVFAGGLEYERVAVGEGSICVLTTRGAPVWTQGDEGTFKFQDDGGTNYFGFAKTDSYTIGANTDGITVSGDMVTMTYNITMSGRPCVWYKEDLQSDTPWEQLNLPDGTATPGASHGAIWENNPPAGTQVCYINVGDEPKGFFRATIEVAGEAKFMTNMPADLSGGIICTNTATRVNGVIKPTFNGSTVIWNWSAQ